MYNFQYAAIQGYGTYRDRVLIPLAKRGVVWLRGVNHDTKGGSNGSGKTLLCEFLGAMLYRVFTDDDMYGEKNLLGELCWKYQDKTVRLFQFRKLDLKTKKELATQLKIDEKSFKPSGFLIFVNGKNRTKHTIPENRKFLQKLFNLTEEEFLGGVHITPTRAHTLVSGTAPERRRYFEQAFSILATYKTLQEKLGDKYDTLDEQIRELDLMKAKLESYQGQLIELKDKAALEGLITDLEKKYVQVNQDKTELEEKVTSIENARGRNQRRKEIEDKLAELPEVSTEEYKAAKAALPKLVEQSVQLRTDKKIILTNAKAQTRLAELKPQIKDLDLEKDYETAIEKLNDKSNALSAEAQGIENQLRKFKALKADLCPTCSQPVSRKFVQDNITDLEKKHLKIEAESDAVMEKLQQRKKENKIILEYVGLRNQLKDQPKLSLEEIEKKSSQVVRKINDSNEAIDNYKQAKTWKEMLEKHPKEKVPSKELYLKFKERLKNLSSEFELIVREKAEYEVQLKQVKSLQKKISEAKALLQDYTKLKKQLKMYDVLYKAYGDRGLKLKQITNLCKRLVDQLPRYSALMFQEKNLTFTTNTKKENFDIIAHRQFKGRKKSLDIKRFSAGEKKRFIPSLMLAQNALIPARKRCNIFIADELDANLDSIAKKAFVNNLVPVLSQKFETAIIIAHSDEMKPAKCEEWVVTKRNGVSQLEIKE